MKIYSYTLGCKVNQYETRAVTQMFLDGGYEEVVAPTDADVILVNTCSVTAEGARKSRQAARRLSGLNPDAVIAVMGCLAQTEPDAGKMLALAHVIVGTKARGKVYELVREYMKTKRRISLIENSGGDEDILSVRRFGKRTKAYIKIQDGCNRFCGYCIIPYARGVVKSRCEDEITREAAELAKNGYSELILVGINLLLYDGDLAGLVLSLSRIDGIKRIELGSLEPELVTEELLSGLSKINSFVPHFHLSLQSGCDKTLEAMNRNYTTDDYRNIVVQIRSYFKSPVITTDVIVGYPGENKEDFDASKTFVQEIGFCKVHVFKYSKRAGTKAASMEGQIPEAEKSRRAQVMSDGLQGNY